MLILVALFFGFAQAQEPARAATPPPPNLGPTKTSFCTMTAGVSQTVNPKDIIIVPAGTPHKFSQLDGPISYVIYRFEAPPGK